MPKQKEEKKKVNTKYFITESDIEYTSQWVGITNCSDYMLYCHYTCKSSSFAIAVTLFISPKYLYHKVTYILNINPLF